jgi:hypothetical protein
MEKTYDVEDWGELTLHDLGAVYQCTRSDAWPVMLDLFKQYKVMMALAALGESGSEHDWHGAKGVKLFVDKCDALEEVVDQAFTAAGKGDKTE